MNTARFIQLSSVFACTALLACKAATNSQCLSTGSSSVKLAPEGSIVQGGYIHFGDKSCSATFEIVDITSDTINLKAFSARHCRFENGLQLDQVKVSFHIEGSSKRSKGYIKNVPAEESFVTLAKSAVTEVAKLNLPDMTGRFLYALRIPTQYDPWGQAVFSDNAETVKDPGSAPDSSLICNNREIFTPLDNPWKTLTESCWSFLDLGTFDITIRNSPQSAKVFSALSQELMQKQKRFNDFMARDAALKTDYQQHKKRIDDTMALLRVQKAASLAFLLNFDLCKPALKRDDLCRNQRKLIEIMGQNFKYVNENRVMTNIFDWLAATKTVDGAPIGALSLNELLAGKRMKLENELASFEQAEQLSAAFGSEFTIRLKEKTIFTLNDLKKMLEFHSRPTDINELSPVILLGTNFSTRTSSGAISQQFAMINLRNIFNDSSKVRLVDTQDHSTLRASHGVSKYGTLRLAATQENQLVKFQPTDSGSMLLLKGVVPLMVLNTVDGVGTSGGSAILALPESEEDQEVIARTGRKTAPVARGSGNSNSTVEINNGGFGNGVNTACR
ncbi:MAG: hypothetical protein RI932_1985 [Pseudomonadota bacterium]|jgi:hypothetical protein